MKLLFLGDSITDMGRRFDVPDYSIHSYGDGYVFVLASHFARISPTKYQILNRGISGNRIVDLYARIKKDVWNLKPDVLTILIGTNDVWHELSQNGVELDRWERIYRTIIDETKERLPDTKIIMCEPYVLYGDATKENFEHFEKIKEYAKVAARIAHDYGIPFVKLQEPLDKAAEKYSVEDYMFDGVHPAIAGATLIADEWLKVFEKEVTVK